MLVMATRMRHVVRVKGDDQECLVRASLRMAQMESLLPGHRLDMQDYQQRRVHRIRRDQVHLQ